MRLHLLLALFATFVSVDIARADPNVGEMSVDFVMSQGDCAKALELAEPHASRGEPWAQYRMGMINFDERCPIQLAKAIEWLQKAATFKAESDWEKGVTLPILGPSGYFNARSSATKAAVTLGKIFATAGYPAMNWYWSRRAATQYSADEKQYKELALTVESLEASVPSSDQAKITQHWDSTLPWHK